MDRKRELDMLSQADRNIASAELAVMGQIAGLGETDCPETALAERTLRAFTHSLSALKRHRELIVHTIQQMDRHLI